MANGWSRRRRSRGLVAAVAVVGGLAALPGPAAAHVHGITPLRCVGNDQDGADQTENTPAFTLNGGPIPEGLIPSGLGRSDLGLGDGGFDTPACPA
jgi:hypothetical protein